ncbi:glycosyltransferase family 90 protein [Teratosphaeria destructans]|uniref:Glycosyltransferase family 90 protein n=1 Tax=Teratosphaeria destructans TaxID=418781 RepID=A0A9W7SUN7_9PEZI|nr:glycosyltransferase family 90 protein [Teratosphaeria destructans]
MTRGPIPLRHRRRRGRQPPPGFDVWFHFAVNSSAVIVEQFWDRIYDDLGPFWGVPAKQLREESNRFQHRVSVRGGNATGHTDIDERPWINIWTDMIQSVASMLPDVDVPINVMDESRVVVPWEDINAAMAEERKTRRVVPEQDLKTSFGTLKLLDNNPPKDGEVQDPPFEIMGPYWPLAVVGCPPESPARKAYIDTDFRKPPPLTGQWPRGSYEGYVQNWTLAKSPCDNADLQGLHGSFVEPISISTTKRLFPLFGGSKLPMNNEILLPPAMYWTDDPFYSGGPSHGKAWEEKHDSVVWRGAASGGRNREENWTRFQRHRFIAMVNATAVKLAETGEQEPKNFALPMNNTYDLAAHLQTLTDSHNHGHGTALSDWIDTWSDAAFVHLLCFPGTDSPHDRDCPYTSHYFSVASTMSMREQYPYKYLPDIDGNSFSGRYRAFLYSTSLPIKATIYNEWHDSRLVPWKHFVPMDNTFSDFYGIMEYFLGNDVHGLEGVEGEGGVGGHDDVAGKIALGGKGWAERVLRKEDMQVYVLRLLLEFARLCDEERERLGWREGVGRDGYG